MKKPKGNHPWRIPTTSSGHKIPTPDELYFYDDLDDLPIMSDSQVIDTYSFMYKKIKQEDSYD
jgi:hypothetical protein